MRFDGRAGLVAGGASGIGLATATELARRGAAVMVADLDGPRALATVEAIRREGGRAEACPLDVTRAAEVETALARARDAFGRLDLVFDCAGILRVEPLEAATEKAWQETLAVNLTGAFLLTRGALRALRAQGGGVIVHVASRLALRAKEEHAAYAASKAGVVQLTRLAALEGAPHGIRVNCVAPGFIDTPMTRGGYDGDAFEAWSRVCPLGRPGRAEEVAAAMLFLASDEASFITGVVLPVDGGRTLL